jgi:hypothetical protein
VAPLCIIIMYLTPCFLHPILHKNKALRMGRAVYYAIL